MLWKITRASGYTLGFFGKLALFMEEFPLTSKFALKIRSQTQMINPVLGYELEKETGKLLAKVYGAALAIMGLVIIFNLKMGFDLFYFIAGIFGAYVLMDALVSAKFSKDHRTLKEEGRDAITNIRHYYKQTGHVDTAINMAIPEAKGLIKSHLEDIYNILVMPFSKATAKAEEYMQKAPDSFLVLLLAIATATKESGDGEDENGNSTFLADLSNIKTDLSNDILGDKQNEAAFKGIIITILGPLLAIKPFEWWATANMPEISRYYVGIYSTVSIMATFFVTTIIYSLVNTMKNGSAKKNKEGSIFAKVADISGLSEFLNKRINAKYTHYLKIDSDLRGIGDHTGVKAYIVKKATYAVLMFALTIIVFMSGTYIAKSSFMNDFKEDFADSVTVTEEYKDTMRETAKEFVWRVKTERNIDELALAAQIKAEYGMTNDNAAAVAKSVVAHHTSAKNTYFKWWYLIVAYLVATLAWFEPDMMLNFNKRMIDTKRQEEITQFQTIMLILMHLPGTNIAKILEWLERFSDCFKESITMCRAELGHGQRKAILRMKEAETHVPFRSFCDNLLAIDKVGVAEAFDELVSDRTYLAETKKQDRSDDIIRKAKTANAMSFIPAGMVLGLYLLIPMIMLVIDMLKEFKSVMG